MATCNAVVTTGIADVVRDCTMTVTVVGLGRLRSRIWLGSQFIRLGVWVMGMGCKIQEADESNPGS